MPRPKHTAKERAAKSAGITRRALNKRLANSADYEISRAAKEKHTARLRELQAERATIELAKARGSVIDREKVAVASENLGIQLKAMIQAWAHSIAGRAEGLTAPQIYEIIDTEAHKLMLKIHDEAEKVLLP